MSIRRYVDSFARHVLILTSMSRRRESTTCSENDNPRDHSSMLVELEMNRIMMTFHSKLRSYQWCLLRNVNNTFIHRETAHKRVIDRARDMMFCDILVIR